MGNNPVGKKVNTLKGKYPGKYLFLLLALGFYLNPSIQCTHMPMTVKLSLSE